MSAQLTETQLIEAAITIFRNENNEQHITNITVRHHRQTFIVSALINNKPTSKHISKAVASTTADLIQDGLVEHVENENLHDIQFATCIGCNQIGPIGNLCNESSCEDSGNIFADNPFYLTED